MKAIILAGGTGSRLFPLTFVTSKQLLPVYDKPMIYYPLSTVMKAGIREILLIVTPESQQSFQKLLGNGSQWGVEISYAVQDSPRGIAEALIIGEKFLANSGCLLTLGDNLVLVPPHLEREIFNQTNIGALIFAYEVSNPQDYGVVEFDSEKRIKQITEKPKIPNSNFAIPGVYFLDNRSVDFARNSKPSLRMEYEITDILNQYLELRSLEVVVLPRGTTWLDMGTFEQLHNASSLICTLQSRQGILIGSPDETALNMGWISSQDVLRNVEKYAKENSYYIALKNLCK